MSRITGTDAFNMMEAYTAVYAPQEITEEQVWEEVEAWVNSLVEEGHDLSEYTWEDMYEAYIEEQGRLSGPERRAQQASLRQQGGALGQRATQVQVGGGPRGQGGNILRRPGEPGRTSQPTTRIQRGVTPTTTAAAKPTPSAAKPTPSAAIPAAPAATRPAAPAATRPAAPAATRPAAPAARPAAPAARPAAPAAPARTFNPLMQRTFGYQTGYAPSQIKQDPKKMAKMGSLRGISSSFDPFDIVQGYLIDEGYAETEEAASVIMANMSEEWKESILESGYFPTKESQREDEKKYRMGSNVKHRTVQTQAKPTPSNLK